LPRLIEDVGLGKAKPWDGWLYPPGGATCSLDYISTPTSAYDSGNTFYGGLPCAEYYVDVFTLEGVAGGVMYITVDTTSGAPALDPAMWVFTPESCTELYAGDNFACSLGTSGCPSMSVATDSGEYLLVVSQTGDCGSSTGDPGDYRLDIDASWDPKLTQIRDDLDNVGPSVLHVVGAATLTK
jgi:hypothetical protein